MPASASAMNPGFQHLGSKGDVVREPGEVDLRVQHGTADAGLAEPKNVGSRSCFSRRRIAQHGDAGAVPAPHLGVRVEMQHHTVYLT